MKKVLLIDDSPSIRHVMKIALEMEGFQVVVAADGIEGLAQLENEQFAVIVSDLHMPNMNGLEFFKQVKAAGNITAKLIMLTTELDEKMKNQGRNLGINAWLVKPLRKEQLLASINSFIGV